jgi:dTDP-4-dehydrorhamnose reductase
MRILITGAGGMVGGRLCSLLSPRHEVTAAIRTKAAPDGTSSVSLDLIDEAAVADALRTVRPLVVIHCAALADPEICERDPERAHLENAVATRVVAQACRQAGARLIALSTDLVFNGQSSFSNEHTEPRPISVYGRSKLEAEIAAIEECRNSVIARVALVAGRGHGARLTASEGIARRLRAGERLTLYRDEWRTPIDCESLAKGIGALIDRPDLSGVFHFGGAERLSRLELGRRAAVTLGLDSSLLDSAERAAHKGAPRAEDVSLDITRAERELEWTPLPLDQALGEGR